MPRIVRGALIQATLCEPTTSPLTKIKEAMIEKHVGLIRKAADRGAQVVCLQELFYGPYFPAVQDARWYDMAERVPEGPTIQLMQDVARRHKVVLIVPVHEEEIAGVYYNTSAVIDADGSYLGKYRKTHLPHLEPGFWEKFYFRHGNLGYPVFETRVGKIGVYMCYDRHFPEGAPVPWLGRGGDRFQPVGDRGGAVGVSVEARAAGARGREWILCRRDQPPGLRRAVADRRVLWAELLLRPAGKDHRRGEPIGGRRRDR